MQKILSLIVIVLLSGCCIVLFLFVGCAQFSLNVNRAGNEYVLDKGEHKSSIITVSDDFRYRGQDAENGLSLDYFSANNPYRIITVRNDFGWSYAKGSFKYMPEIEGSKEIEVTYDQLQRTVIFKNRNGESMITRQLISSDRQMISSEGINYYLNLYATYSEQLPDKYQFDSWESSIPKNEKEAYLQEREAYENDFRERANLALRWQCVTDGEKDGTSLHTKVEDATEKYMRTQAAAKAKEL